MLVGGIICRIQYNISCILHYNLLAANLLNSTIRTCRAARLLVARSEPNILTRRDNYWDVAKIVAQHVRK